MAASERQPLKFQYTRNDYLAAMGGRFSRTRRAKLEALAACLAIIVGLLCFMGISHPTLGPYLVLLGPYLLGAGMTALMFSAQHHGVSLNAMMGHDAPLGTEHTLSADDDAVTISSPTSTFRADW